jgi:hypothetical protein
VKSEAEVRSRLATLLTEEVTARVESLAERLPHKCTHNYRHPLDSRKQVNGEPNEHYNRVSYERGLPVLQTVGLCMLGSEQPEEWPGLVCDEPIDAKKCPYFTPKASREEVLKEVTTQVQDGAWVEKNLPEAHALMWALEDITLPKLPWWGRFLTWLRRPKLEGTQPSSGFKNLLPPDR